MTDNIRLTDNSRSQIDERYSGAAASSDDSKECSETLRDAAWETDSNREQLACLKTNDDQAKSELLERSKRNELLSPAVELPVFFASCRQAVTSNKDDRGKELGPMQLGCATARVPAEKSWLEAPNDLSDNLERLGWKVNEKDPTLKPYVELRGYVAEENTNAVLRDVHVEDKFWDNLRTEVANEPKHRVYVYIHGFASSGENSVYAGGVLSSQLQAPVVSFTWPSAGKIGRGIFGPNSTRGLYKNERKMIDSNEVMQDLSKFLTDMKKELPPDTEINLVAHSLGNKLLTKYLDDDNAKEKFNSVYFLAPDVDKKAFLHAVPDILNKSNYVAVYMNPEDKVLGASSINNLLELKSGKKLGKANIAAPGIEFVNYQEVATGFGHYIPFEQFGSIVRTGLPYSDESQGQDYFLIRRTKIEKQDKGVFAPVPKQESIKPAFTIQDPRFSVLPIPKFQAAA